MNCIYKCFKIKKNKIISHENNDPNQTEKNIIKNPEDRNRKLSEIENFNFKKYSHKITEKIENINEPILNKTRFGEEKSSSHKINIYQNSSNFISTKKPLFDFKDKLL